MHNQEQTQTCSPPRSKFGEHTIKEQSILKRSNQAKIIVLGSVVETYPDKYGQSISVRVAVHMVLKSKNKVKKYITVNGFDNDLSDAKNKLFVSQANVDCVNSVVELYGSYIFFIRENIYGDYYVDEINLQPANTEIPCKPELSRRVKRLIIKYRKEKNNRAQCNDFARSASNFSRKCLKHRTFSRMLDEFKYKQLPIRKFFCSVKRAESLKKIFPTELTMRDDVGYRRKKTKEPNIRDSDRKKVNEKDNKINENNKQDTNDNIIEEEKTSTIRQSGRGGNIILYTKSEKYIVHENIGGQDEMSDKTSSTRNRLNLNIPDWRYFQHHQSNTAASHSSNLIHANLFTLCITLLVTSLIYACL